MFSKQGLRSFLKIFLVLSLSSLVFSGQLKLLCKFNGVEIPYRLKYKDVVFEKGKYNLEAVKDRTAPRYYLRIKKGRKVLWLLRGEQLAYTSHGMAKPHDPNIPDKPTLRIKKNLEEKVIYFIVETGKKNRMAPYQKLRFKLEYEE